MNTLASKISTILLELREASQSIKAGANLNEVSNKYDISFLGDEFNVIYSIELLNSSALGLNTDIAAFNSVIPVVCDNLRMKCIPMQDQEHTTLCFEITL